MLKKLAMVAALVAFAPHYAQAHEPPRLGLLTTLSGPLGQEQKRGAYDIRQQKTKPIINTWKPDCALNLHSSTKRQNLPKQSAMLRRAGQP